MRYLLATFVLFAPQLTFAAVIINEVAWMGNDASANDEWIELYNNGSTISVDGWELSDDMNLMIPLVGSIGANQYAVLERTDDDSASGAAFLIYTGALANTGATLTLRRADGSIEDQVAGGENWAAIGGDNVTKETAQFTSAGWITAPATPRAFNATTGTESEVDEEVEDTDTSDEAAAVDSLPQSKQSSGSSETTNLILPGVTLRLVIDAQRVSYVNQPVDFIAQPSGIGEVLIDSLTYEWNFGDTNTATGQTVSHAYTFPGEYVVTVYGGYKRQEQVARHTVTVLPVALSLARTSAGDIQLHNNAKYEVDISGYTLFADRRFELPARSIMLPGATITIPKEKVAADHDDIVRLHDQGSVLVAHSFIAPAAVTVADNTNPATTEAVPPAVQVVTAVPSPTRTFASDVSEPSIMEKIEPSEPRVLSAATIAATPRVTQEKLVYLGLIGLLLFGLLIFLSRSVKNPSVAN